MGRFLFFAPATLAVVALSLLLSACVGQSSPVPLKQDTPPAQLDQDTLPPGLTGAPAKDAHIPEGTNVTSVGFGRAIPDAEVEHLLRRYGVRASGVWLIVADEPGMHEVPPESASVGLIREARRAKAEAARTNPCFLLVGLGTRLADRRVFPAPGERDPWAQVLLSRIEMGRAARGRLLRGEPAVYGLTVVGQTEALRRLAADPLVRLVNAGPNLPEQPHILPSVDSLSTEAVRARLARYARQGLPECREHVRNAEVLEPTVRTPQGAVVNGVVFRTRTKSSAVREDGTLGPARVQVVITVHNPADQGIGLPVLGCTESLRVYRDPERKVLALPHEGRGRQCMMEPYTIALAPGERRDFEIKWASDLVLADSLPTGRYYLTATFRLRNRTLEIPAGDAVFTTGLEPLRYRASIHVHGGELLGRATVVNGGIRPVALEFGSCAVNLRAYRNAERSGLPVWRSEFRGADMCNPVDRAALVAPGDSLRPFEIRLPLSEVVGDSLPDGRYYFTAEVRLNSGRSPEIPAGDAHIVVSRGPLSGERTSGAMKFQSRTVTSGTNAQTVRMTVTGTLAHAGGPLERFSAECPVVLYVYRSRAQRDAAPRSGEPAWKSHRQCGPEEYEFSLDRGRPLTFAISATARQILGDSLPSRRYYFAAAIQHERRRVFVSAGEAVLRR